MSFTVAILGRPNVGKSTLFNRLTGKRFAIVDDTPGVTRDRREADGAIADMRFRLIDTAGLEDAEEGSLQARMRAQTERAMAEADVSLLVIDARAGITPVDEHFADWLRRSGRPVLLVANKCESRTGMSGAYDAYRLGLGDPIPVSAEHGEGMGELYEALLPYEKATPDDSEAPDPKEPENPEPAVDLDDDIEVEDGDLLEDDEPAGPLRIAIVGRPNVGKSTLANALLGEDRLLTGPEAGITRDAIAVDWTFAEREIRLVDTAGLRKRARVTDKLEKMSTEDTARAIRLAQIVIVVIDAREGFERQDLHVARDVVDEGRALVIAANKWDLIEGRDRAEAMKAIQGRLQISLPQARGVPVVSISALEESNLDRLMRAVFGIETIWNTRVGTARLNGWLAEMVDRHPPPLAQGRRIKLRYITQVKSRPPTFAIWVSRPKDLPAAYQSYLVHGLRKAFGMEGVPIRLSMRKGKNPYADG